MQTVQPSQLRRGMVLMLDGAPHLIEDSQHVGAAQAKPKTHAKMRNLRTGRLVERTIADNEHLATAEVEHRTVQFSYRQGDQFVFIDGRTFDTLELSAERVGNRQGFLKEDRECRAFFLNGELLDIELPEYVPMKVVETAAAQRSAQQSTYKEAKLEGGLETMVPLFIATGDVIRVDTRSRKYVGKD